MDGLGLTVIHAYPVRDVVSPFTIVIDIINMTAYECSLSECSGNE